MCSIRCAQLGSQRCDSFNFDAIHKRCRLALLAEEEDALRGIRRTEAGTNAFILVASEQKNR